MGGTVQRNSRREGKGGGSQEARHLVATTTAAQNAATEKSKEGRRYRTYTAAPTQAQYGAAPSERATHMEKPPRAHAKPGSRIPRRAGYIDHTHTIRIPSVPSLRAYRKDGPRKQRLKLESIAGRSTKHETLRREHQGGQGSEARPCVHDRATRTQAHPAIPSAQCYGRLRSILLAFLLS